MSMTASAAGDDQDEPPTPIREATRDERGTAAEILMCDELALEHTEPLAEEPDVFDARFERPGRVLDGRPAEIKSCLPWILDAGTPRRGRFWIRRGAHDELVDRGGVYVFVVIDPDSTLENPEYLDYATVPANESFTSWLTWSSCGRRHTADQSAQFTHAKLFPQLANHPKTILKQ